MSQYEYKNAFGSVEISTEGCFVVASFKGAISESIALYFYDALDEVAKDIKNKAWVYVSNSKEAEAATPEAQKIFNQSALKAKQLGCVRSAYVLSSHIAIAQMARVRKHAGGKGPIEECTFDKLEDAKHYLSQFV